MLINSRYSFNAFAFYSLLLGLWLGLFICVSIQAVVFLILIFKLNWKKVTHKVGCSYCTSNHYKPDLSKKHRGQECKGENFVFVSLGGNIVS